MADLTSIEKLKLEKLFEMRGGYVLDFTNFTFQEFILESISVDIYEEKYYFRSGSKANRLRALWYKESNKIVGTLIQKLLDYWETKKVIDSQSISYEEQKLKQDCHAIASRLKGDSKSFKSEEKNDSKSIAKTKAELLERFDELATFQRAEGKRERGYLLENLLSDTFNFYGLPTQKAFRRNEGGEQIDGAFKLEGWYYLVECKWTEKLSDIRQLDSLYGKINRSGKQTLGLFLSINGWSNHVTQLLKQNHDKSIILMDGFDLRSVLVEHNGFSLEELLIRKLEHLNLEGEPFLSVATLSSGGL